MEKAMSYVEEGGQKINSGLKANDIMEVQAGNKLIEFERQQQWEATKKLSWDFRRKRQKLGQLFKISKAKKNLNLKLEYSSETKISITWVYGILLVCSTAPELLCLAVQNINLVM